MNLKNPPPVEPVEPPPVEPVEPPPVEPEEPPPVEPVEPPPVEPEEPPPVEPEEPPTEPVVEEELIAEEEPELTDLPDLPAHYEFKSGLGRILYPLFVSAKEDFDSSTINRRELFEVAMELYEKIMEMEDGLEETLQQEVILSMAKGAAVEEEEQQQEEQQQEEQQQGEQQQEEEQAEELPELPTLPEDFDPQSSMAQQMHRAFLDEKEEYDNAVPSVKKFYLQFLIIIHEEMMRSERAHGEYEQKKASYRAQMELPELEEHELKTSRARSAYKMFLEAKEQYVNALDYGDNRQYRFDAAMNMYDLVMDAEREHEEEQRLATLIQKYGEINDAKREEEQRIHDEEKRIAKEREEEERRQREIREQQERERRARELAEQNKQKAIRKRKQRIAGLRSEIKRLEREHEARIAEKEEEIRDWERIRALPPDKITFEFVGKSTPTPPPGEEIGTFGPGGYTWEDFYEQPERTKVYYLPKYIKFRISLVGRTIAGLEGNLATNIGPHNQELMRLLAEEQESIDELVARQRELDKFNTHPELPTFPEDFNPKSFNGVMWLPLFTESTERYYDMRVDKLENFRRAINVYSELLQAEAEFVEPEEGWLPELPDLPENFVPPSSGAVYHPFFLARQEKYNNDTHSKKRNFKGAISLYNSMMRDEPVSERPRGLPSISIRFKPKSYYGQMWLPLFLKAKQFYQGNPQPYLFTLGTNLYNAMMQAEDDYVKPRDGWIPELPDLPENLKPGTAYGIPGSRYGAIVYMHLTKVREKYSNNPFHKQLRFKLAMDLYNLMTAVEATYEEPPEQEGELTPLPTLPEDFEPQSHYGAMWHPLFLTAKNRYYNNAFGKPYHFTLAMNLYNAMMRAEDEYDDEEEIDLTIPIKDRLKEVEAPQ